MRPKPQAASAARLSAGNRALDPALTVSLVGVGAMGSALGRGWVSGGVLDPGQLTFFELDDKTAKAFAGATGAKRVPSMSWALGARVCVFAVKPQVMQQVLEKAEHESEEPSIWVSVAAGVPLARLVEWSGHEGWARVMPNLACAHQKGTMGMVKHNVPAELDGALDGLFGALGTLVNVTEAQMHAVTALAGSGPAFALAVLDALAQGGVLAGVSYAQALDMALGATEGAITLLREEGVHPSELKSRVSSPGGTTIAGLAALEDGATPGSIIRAVKAAADRSKELAGE